MSYKLPIDVPENVTPVELLRRQLDAYDKAIKSAQNDAHPQVKQWKREVEIWKKILKREEDRETMFWSA